MTSSVRFVPRSLNSPGGAVFLDPAHRVSGAELNRRDARWRALRERAYARTWADDATLVGSVHRYAATTLRQSSLRDFEERSLIGRGSGIRRIGSGINYDEASINHRPRSARDNASIRRDGRLLSILRGNKQGRRFKSTLRRLVGRGRA